MNVDVALYWVSQSMQMAVMLAGPLLIAALCVGICVSLFQAVTSMQEMTLSYIPKIAIVGGVIHCMAALGADGVPKLRDFLPIEDPQSDGDVF